MAKHRFEDLKGRLPVVFVDKTMRFTADRTQMERGYAIYSFDRGRSMHKKFFVRTRPGKHAAGEAK